MGLFGSDTFRKTNIFGQLETDALQPGLFNAFQSIIGSRGVPFMGELNAAITNAYAQAAAQAGQTTPGAAGAAIASDVGKRGQISGDVLRGGVGVQGQANALNTAGIAANYLSNLTSGRPQFGFDPSTPFGDFFAGIETLNKPFEPIMRILGAVPSSPGGGVDPAGLMGPGAGRANPFAGAGTFNLF